MGRERYRLSGKIKYVLAEIWAFTYGFTVTAYWAHAHIPNRRAHEPARILRDDELFKQGKVRLEYADGLKMLLDAKALAGGFLYRESEITKVHQR